MMSVPVKAIISSGAIQLAWLWVWEASVLGLMFKHSNAENGSGREQRALSRRITLLQNIQKLQLWFSVLSGSCKSDPQVEVALKSSALLEPPLLLLSRKFEQPTNSSGIGAAHVHGWTVLCPCCSLLLFTPLKNSTSCWELLEFFSNMRCNSPGGIWCLLHISAIGCFPDL